MPPGYTSQQRASINQFQSFTQVDKNTAIRFLKNHGWNQDAAINGYYSGAGSAGSAQSGSRSSLSKLFDKYREDAAEYPDTIKLDGTMTYLQDIGVSLDGLDFLAVSELIQAPTMGEISRAGFVDGWSSVNCDTLDKMRSHVNLLKQSLPSSKDAFTKVYNYTFQLAKAGNQKTLPLEHATTYWEVVFTSALSAIRWTSPHTPWIEWWVEFLNSEYKRAINKDVWVQTLKFAQQTLQDEAISFWNEESSWPSVIDDFVQWVQREKRGIKPAADEMEE